MALIKDVLQYIILGTYDVQLGPEGFKHENFFRFWYHFINNKKIQEK